MIVPRTNIEKRLSTLRDKEFNPETWKNQVQKIFERDEKHENKILNNLKKSSSAIVTNRLDPDHLETHRVYHLDQIKNICIDYRLRFLDFKYFKGKLPVSALYAIKELEKKHRTELIGFKIMAPSKLFKLENADDPLLFAPMGNDYFYLVHKWGKDLHPMRKSMMWFFKSFENLLILTFLISILVTFMVPNGMFTKHSNASTHIMIFFFMFKSLAAIVLFYGVALGKNFNSAIWNSKYFNA